MSRHELRIELYNRFTQEPGDTANATGLAVQDGAGAWTPVTGTDGVYTVTLASDRYGIAIGCQDAGSFRGKILERAVSDGLLIRDASCHVDPARRRIKLTVDVAIIPDGQVVDVAVRDGGGSASSVPGDRSASLELSASEGPTEVFATMGPVGTTNQIARLGPFELHADQRIALDVATDEVAIERRPLTLTTTADLLGTSAGTAVYTPTGAYLLDTTFGLTCAVLPAALSRPGDQYGISVAGLARVAGGATTIQTQVRTTSPCEHAIDLPSALSNPELVVSAAPDRRPTWSFDASPSRLASRLVTLTASSANAVSDRRDWVVEATPAALGDGHVAYQLPDLAAVGGFPSDGALFGGRASLSMSLDDATADGAAGDAITQSAAATAEITL